MSLFKFNVCTDTNKIREFFEYNYLGYTASYRDIMSKYPYMYDLELSVFSSRSILCNYEIACDILPKNESIFFEFYKDSIKLIFTKLNYDLSSKKILFEGYDYLTSYNVKVSKGNELECNKYEFTHIENLVNYFCKDMEIHQMGLIR